MIALRAEGSIEHTRNCEVHERGWTYSVLFCLIVRLSQQVHWVTIDVYGTFEQFFRVHSREGFEFGQFFEGQIDFGCSSVVFNVFEFVVGGLVKIFFWVFHQIEESDAIGAIAEDSFAFENLAIFQFDSNWSVFTVIDNFIHFGV